MTLQRLPAVPAQLILIAVSQLFSMQGLHAEQPTPPNIVLIMTDDQGYGDLSIHGNPYLETPNIDQLAVEGVQFERFYVNSFCAPTRAALLTGRYPLRTGCFGVTHNKETMRTTEVTIGEVFSAAGYRTGCFGKWHNGEQFPYTPHGQGFHEFFGFHNGHINNYFDPVLLRGTKPEPTAGYISDVITDEAIKFIFEHKDRPFFCYVPYNAPHSPYQVPDKYYDRFRAMKLSESVSAFYGMCENIDDNVGKILRTLEEQVLAENTIVLFLTDNGGTAGVKLYNAGMRGGKTSVHEGGCRVPLFIRWPRQLKTPRVIHQICSHIDLLPTLIEFCGIEKPEGPPLDGISLVPLLSDVTQHGETKKSPERVIFTHNPINETNRYPGAVRTQQYRLVREIEGRQGGSAARENDRDAKPWQLYDLIEDPGQEKNIAKQRPGIVKSLSQQYEDWYDDISSEGLERLPIPVGYQEENPVVLNAPQATVTGSLHYNSGPGFAHDFLINWTDPQSTVSFDLDVVRAGSYRVGLIYGCEAEEAGSRIEVQAGGESIQATVPTGKAPPVNLPNRDERSNNRYVNRKWSHFTVGEIPLSKGRAQLVIKASEIEKESVLDLKGVELTWLPSSRAD